MPRKAFIADLQEAAGILDIDHLSSLKPGDEDGTITFKFHSEPRPIPAAPGVIISAIIPDVSEYPDNHQYILCTDSDNVPDTINTAMQDIGDFPGLTIYPMLSKVAKALAKATAGARFNPVDLDDGDPMDLDDLDRNFTDEDDYKEEDEDEAEEEEEEEDDFSDPSWEIGGPRRLRHSHVHGASILPRDRTAMLALNARIRQDLNEAKKAGFRVGCIGELLNNGSDAFVTISCRISKLGISAEALQAWHLDRELYLTLIIRYTSGYCSLSRLMKEESTPGMNGMYMRVGLSKRYTVKLAEAIQAFSEQVDSSKGTSAIEQDAHFTELGLAPFFISRPLNELLTDRLVVLLKYRSKFAFKWNGAEKYYNDSQGMSISDAKDMDSKYWCQEDALNKTLPPLVTADHFGEVQDSKYPPDELCSFPLTAMQFSLRHLVRCTEFCLVCHCKVETDFEALKPYVCSKPLCLYQYMALGFGPSIEHEIMSQPQVVDLLVSFCYSSAYTSNALKVFPDGMGMTVPNPSWFLGYEAGPARYHTSASSNVPAKTNTSPPETTYTARFDETKNELVFGAGETRPLRAGNWVCVTVPGASDGSKMHCKIVEVLFPIVRLGPAVVTGKKVIEPESTGLHTPFRTQTTTTTTVLTPAATPPMGAVGQSSKLPEVSFTIYDRNFDDLSPDAKSKAIRILLDTLPSITRMKSYLETSRHSSLQSWSDRISPAALGVLRWIIASNRSCIVQVDNDGNSMKSSEERVYGMPAYIQFRFAQGAPDKEQRFIQSIRENIDPTTTDYPTLFAWHGSSLHNWHSIVREGLHFKDIVNGRACGHGVYLSPHASTSLGYSGISYRASYGVNDGSPAFNPSLWPSSQLHIDNALSLNEVVNRPDKFVNTNPHLVVAQLDWIQTRYLFVRSAAHRETTEDVRPTESYAQDPKYTAMGAGNTPISIPITAVSKSRRPVKKVSTNGNKKARLSEEEEIVYLSDDTDVEDLAVFLTEDEPLSTAAESSTSTGKCKENAPATGPTKTDFIPHSLDHSTLPILEPPTYATPLGTRTLQKELQATLKIQDSTPAHELGWYIDRDLISNVYQWIVELHSFEPRLPLAQDMRARDLKSIVLELRFGASYPMSPPFVRVIRPRFLSFMQGGGGHVTAGGALCMELLTNSGWSVASNIESVLVQVRAAISSTDPKPARLEGRSGIKDYGTGEAVEAYIRACLAHGWEVPKDFRKDYGVKSGMN
ncbi:MAG: hypothetical protein Q9195_003557 [Heterodermia aff. obscurata]